MTTVDPASNYDTKFFVTPDTAENTVYTVPDGYMAVMVQQIRCVDAAGSARTITVKAHISGADYIVCCPGTVIPALGSLDIEFKPLMLKSGDTIKATGSASGIHIMVSFAANTRRS